MTQPKSVSRPHRVFLSHSSLDRKTAERVLKQLESEGIDCWVSHRDIEPGSEWAETIYDAIASSKAMILLFTGNANESWQVRNELDIATNLKVPIIPVRFDDTTVSKGVRYFTSSHQWLEPHSNGRRTKRNDLVTAVRGILGAQAATASDDMPPRTVPAAKRKALLPLLALIPATLLSVLLLNGRGGTPVPAENLFVLMAGGSDSWNYASDIVSTGDKGFLAAGTWDWGFWSEVWVARFDSVPSLLWSWSDSLTGECSPRILITEDRGLIVAFGEYSDFDQEGYWVRALRLDSTGAVLWDTRKRIEWTGAIQPVFGNMAWNADGSVSMAFTLRILTNMAPFHNHIVELDPAGGEMHWRTIPDRRECVAFLPLPDGGAFHVYLDVLSQSNGIEHFSPDGTVLNNLVIGDLRSQATCAVLTSDGGILLAVTGDSYGSGNGDLWLMRFSNGLELLWQQTFGGDLLDSASEVLQIPGGGFLVVGGSRSFGDGSSDGWIIRVTENGELIWQSFLNLGGHERLVSADMDSDGSFLLAGYSTALRGEPDALLARISPCGELDDTIRVGLDILHEDWGKGFLDQAVWLMGRNRNYSPAIRADSAGERYSLDLKGVPILYRFPFPLSTGLCVSAEVMVPDMPTVSGNNWISVGFTDSSIDAFHRDPFSVPLAQIRWNYTDDGNAGQRSVEASYRLTGTNADHARNDLEWLSTGVSQKMAIEAGTGSFRYWLNDSLFHESPRRPDMPDSVSIYLWGNSVSLPHGVRNVRVFRRRW